MSEPQHLDGKKRLFITQEKGLPDDEFYGYFKDAINYLEEVHDFIEHETFHAGGSVLWHEMTEIVEDTHVCLEIVTGSCDGITRIVVDVVDAALLSYDVRYGWSGV